ncbi:t-complex protein 1 [Fusarium austroafricanum]|uniref:T-complex protein 1 n=1 Tax=Fusarium austroafricanum TaxID=2364996 RepID=A0A8H4KSK9_9HYPO|nr:t-complex protein 1 [Fusarium austroafricanum]
MLSTQQRIMQLKKERDERMNAIVKESAAELDKLRARVVTYQQDRRKKEVETIAASVLRIIEAVERRKDIEQEMATLVSQVTNTTREVEDMMKIGFRGREEDVKKAR